MNILREIDTNATMLDMVRNVLDNLNFYIVHRNVLADINLSNIKLEEFIKNLRTILWRNSTLNNIPDWFLYHKPYHFTSSGFPYFNSYLPWKFSFKDWVDVVVSGEGEIDEKCDFILIKGQKYTKEEWIKLNQ